MTTRDLLLVGAIINAAVFVLLAIGYVLIRQKKRDAHKWAMIAACVLAALFLASYLTLHPLYSGPTPQEAFKAARALHHDQKDQEALAAYENAASLGSLEAKCYAAVLGDRLRDTETASAAIASVLATDPSNTHCSVLKARAMIYADRVKQALPILEEAVKRAPEDAFFWASLGFAHFTATEYRQAAAAFEKSAELDPSLPANIFNAGYAHYLDGKYSRALPLLEKAITLPLDEELKERAQESLELISGALWVCPMHPDRTGKPGEKCPDCGMKLEPNPHGLDERDVQ